MDKFELFRYCQYSCVHQTIVRRPITSEKFLSLVGAVKNPIIKRPAGSLLFLLLFLVSFRSTSPSNDSLSLSGPIVMAGMACSLSAVLPPTSRCLRYDFPCVLTGTRSRSFDVGCDALFLLSHQLPSIRAVLVTLLCFSFLLAFHLIVISSIHNDAAGLCESYSRQPTVTLKVCQTAGTRSHGATFLVVPTIWGTEVRDARSP